MEKGQKLIRYDTTRLSINIPVKLKNRVWKYSYELGLPVTQTVILLLNQALESKDLLRELPEITDLIREIKVNQYKDKESNKLV